MIERKEREKEGCRSTRPPPSEGIETDSSLDRRPIPPTWRRVVPGAHVLATRVDPPQEQSLECNKEAHQEGLNVENDSIVATKDQEAVTHRQRSLRTTRQRHHQHWLVGSTRAKIFAHL